MRKFNICYFGIYAPSAPRDKIYLEGLKKRGQKICECVDGSPGFLKFFGLVKKHREFRNSYDILWVGYLSTMVVPLARIISRRKIVFNALDSWYDRAIRDRAMYSKYSPKAMIIWIFDFLAFHLSDVVLVESESQKKFLSKSFFVMPNKFSVIFTGADSEVFFLDSNIQKRSKFTVVFRGMFLPATGVRYVIEAARLLRDKPIDFIIIGWGSELAKVKNMMADYELPKVTLITAFLQSDVLRNLMLSCHVMLGQFEEHQRLERTIQHKTFEALALGMPYITRESKSNRELLTDGANCLFVPPKNPEAICEAILRLEKNPDLSKRIASGAYELYQQRCSQEVLVNELEILLQSLS